MTNPVGWSLNVTRYIGNDQLLHIVDLFVSAGDLVVRCTGMYVLESLTTDKAATCLRCIVMP